ncbi:cytochrome d ubiquinol oxidase subunit II [Fodinicola acaciae]|uniref:cytochrome d ubiquinol oxidase subunit II n=1 Tax=Fodinicola acaciae TaxID=2681555 RepID=UPI0013D0681E|nr:cytochrome d ubiquinol oxidase subunit II [Fodinicola acaciae]
MAEFWFIVIAVLWIGFFFLEGFDFGVGMLLPFLPENERQKRVLINTIGPVWDGNEVWLITAVGATFAAFPRWYAAWLSALYLPLVLVLLGLIVRGVAFEYRGQLDSPRWRRWWTAAICTGSLVPCLGIGYALTTTLTGLPLDSAGNRVGGPFAVFSWPAMVGAIGFVGFALLHGSAFLALKTDGAVRRRAVRITLFAPLALLPLAIFSGWLPNDTVTWLVWGIGIAAGLLAWLAAWRRREGLAFLLLGGFLVATLASAFVAQFPVVLPSTVDTHWSLTVATASASPYPLTVMTWLAAFGLPLVLAYQAWTYWVFRRRIGDTHIPDGAH